MKYADKHSILDFVATQQGTLAVQEKRLSHLDKLFDRINSGATPVNFPGIRQPNLALGRELAPVWSIRRLNAIYNRSAVPIAARQLAAQADMLLLRENRKHLIDAGIRFRTKKALIPENDGQILQLQADLFLLDQIINDQFDDLDDTSLAQSEQFNNTVFAEMFRSASLQFQQLRQKYTDDPPVFQSSEDQEAFLDIALLGEETAHIALTDALLRQVFLNLYMANEAKRLFFNHKIGEKTFLLLLNEHIDTAFENLEIVEKNIEESKETVGYIEEKALSAVAFPQGYRDYTMRASTSRP